MGSGKNYHQQGGEKWVVEGELELTDGGRLLFNGQELKPAEGLVDSSADTVAKLKTDFNSLLAKLYAAGLMAADKSDLEDAILAALVVLEEAVVGTEPGEYPEAAHGTFVTAIETAQGVFDEIGVSQTEVNTAITTLGTAVSTFEGTVIGD